jgi:YgiT-type zinc finger domain-containing protein
MLQISPMVAEPAGDSFDESICGSCGGGRLRPDHVRAAFWQGDRLVVVEDMPALVCEACGERYYDDATVTALDILRGAGFPEDRAKAVIEVSVFSLARPRCLVDDGHEP